MIGHIIHKFKFGVLKKRIIKNPCIGTADADGSFIYKHGSYVIRYRIKKDDGTYKGHPEWISQKRRVNFFERKINGIRESFLDLLRYQKWLVFFHPPVFFLLLICFLLFYFGLVETQKAKIERLKWTVAAAIGVSPNQIRYIGDGWLQIYAQRQTAVDKQTEIVGYTFNPFTWLFSPEAFVGRLRGEPFGSITHPVVYNERGEVWINNEGEWRYGRIMENETIKWDVPQGTGVRAGKVFGHKIFRDGKKIYISDK